MSTPSTTPAPTAAAGAPAAAAQAAAGAAAATPAPRKSKKMLMMATAGFVLLASAAGGAFWWTRSSNPSGEEHKPAVERGAVPFEPFVVNLADEGGSRFLRLKLQLVVKDAETAEKLEKSSVTMLQARSAILELLTTQQAEVLVTAEGKAALRTAIATHVGQAFGIEVEDVLFSDFVVQF